MCNTVQCRAEYLKLSVSQTGVDVTSRMKQNHFSGGNWKHCDCSGFFDCLVNECDDAEKQTQQTTVDRNMYFKWIWVLSWQMFKVCWGFNQSLQLKVADTCVLGEIECLPNWPLCVCVRWCEVNNCELTPQAHFLLVNVHLVHLTTINCILSHTITTLPTSTTN